MRSHYQRSLKVSAETADHTDAVMIVQIGLFSILSGRFHCMQTTSPLESTTMMRPYPMPRQSVPVSPQAQVREVVGKPAAVRFRGSCPGQGLGRYLRSA